LSRSTPSIHPAFPEAITHSQVTDDYGRTHSVYYSKMNEVADAPAKNGKKPGKTGIISKS
jgi:hypothetical protein